MERNWRGLDIELRVEVEVARREYTRDVISFRWLQFDLHRRTGQEGEHRSNQLRQLNSNETHIDCSTIYSRPVPFPFVSFQWSPRSLHSIVSLILFSSLRLIFVLSLFQSPPSLYRPRYKQKAILLAYHIDSATDCTVRLYTLVEGRGRQGA